MSSLASDTNNRRAVRAGFLAVLLLVVLILTGFQVCLLVAVMGSQVGSLLGFRVLPAGSLLVVLLALLLVVLVGSLQVFQVEHVVDTDKMQWMTSFGE